MKTKYIFVYLILSLVLMSCSGKVEYSEQFKQDTAGKYLYNPDEIIEVYYKNDKLHLTWKEGEVQPVALDTNEFFVADMYTKLHFVKHPETNERYLSKINDSIEDMITYDYIKVSDTYKTPSTLLKEGDYANALKGYLEIKKQDSTSSYINEWDFNRLGYQAIRDKDYKKAIEIFKLNVALHPNSVNVYDSLAEGYLWNKDSLKAYENYKIAYQINPRNRRAKNYIDHYNSLKE